MARPGFEPAINRSEIHRANHYSISPLFENQQIYLYYIHCDETKSESWPVQILVSAARVKLELIDFSRLSKRSFPGKIEVKEQNVSRKQTWISDTYFCFLRPIKYAGTVAPYQLQSLHIYYTFLITFNNLRLTAT